MQYDAYGEPIVRDEARMQRLRDDPVYMGLLKVRRMATERHIVETEEWIAYLSSMGRDVDGDRRYLARLLELRARHDEEIGSAA